MIAAAHQRFCLSPSYSFVELCEQPIDMGGEGEIYLLRRENQILKRIFKPGLSVVAKLQWMLANRPCRETAWAPEDLGWPEQLVIDPHTNAVVGYVARYFGNAVTLEVVFQRRERLQVFPRWTYAHCVNLAANLARALARAHRLGLVLGDVSARNVLCDKHTYVKLIDLESAQVNSGQAVLPCLVSTADYTAPELHGVGDFSQYRRSVYQDCFSLAVLIYQLLLDGLHPYSGMVEMPTGTQDLPPDIVERIGSNLWPYSSSAAGKPRVMPPHDGCDFRMLPAAIQTLFVRAFDDGYQDPSRRPLPEEFAAALASETKSLRSCHVNPKHHFWSGPLHCPWCERLARHGVDSFPI